eukprot:UN10516
MEGPALLGALVKTLAFLTALLLVLLLVFFQFFVFFGRSGLFPKLKVLLSFSFRLVFFLSSSVLIF